MENTSLIENVNRFKFIPFRSRTQALLLLLLIAFGLYINSVQNECAFDDGINIHQNSYVLQGVSGIPDIINNDTYESFYRRMNADPQLNGGRYRPLTTITFALEQELIGTYRTGYYMFNNDLNNNGKLDDDKVMFTNSNGKAEVCYEYNDYIDVNNDGVAQQNECYACWDTNKNFKNDTSEDVNKDGVFNEIDCQTAGAGFRHFNNVLIFIALIAMLFIFLSDYVFKDQLDMAFISTLIFLIHPLNTETVAVISRRDEMLSLFFILFTLYFSFRYIASNKIKDLIYASVGTMFALLSKEYALMLIFMIPISIHVLLKENIQKKQLLISGIVFAFTYVLLVILKATQFLPSDISYFLIGSLVLIIHLVICFVIFKFKILYGNTIVLINVLIGVYLFYFLMRFNSISLAMHEQDNEVLNNAYIFASGEERISTKVAILLYYLKLLLFPKTLVCDYSYNVIEFKHFTSWEFIFSLLLNLSLIIFGIRSIIKKHVLGFAIAFYYLFLLIVSNFLFFIGTTMNEHFVFHSTVGFAIAITWLIFKGMDEIKLNDGLKSYALIVPFILLTIISGVKIIERNADWKNDVTLFLHDVKNAPNSVICLGNAGARWIDLSDTREITGVLLPGQDPNLYNDYNGNLKINDEEVTAGGYKNKREAAIRKGMSYLEKAVELHPKYVNGYLNLGLASYKLDDHLKAIYYWKIAEALYPNNPYLQNYYAVSGAGYLEKANEYFKFAKYEDAINEFKKCIIINNNKEALLGVAGCYFNLKDKNKTLLYCNKVLKVDPNNAEALKILSSVK